MSNWSTTNHQLGQASALTSSMLATWLIRRPKTRRTEQLNVITLPCISGSLINYINGALQIRPIDIYKLDYEKLDYKLDKWTRTN